MWCRDDPWNAGNSIIDSVVSDINVSACRSCLVTNVEGVHFDPAVFTFCTSIEIADDDRLSKWVCRLCYDLLDKFARFKRQCIDSNLTLLGRVDNVEGKPDIKVEYDKEELDVNKSDWRRRESLYAECLSASNDESDETASIARPVNDVSKVKLKKKDKGKSNKKFKVILKRKHLYERKIFQYSCAICNKKYAYKERLEAHKLTHSGIKEKIVCSVCGKKFKTWPGLRRHNEFVHTSSDERYECVLCSKLFKSSLTLSNHQKLHVNLKNFVCHVCGKAFKLKIGLQKHVETHIENREKNHECKICGSKFASAGYLASHMFRHKERRFICDLCSFPFIKKSDLTRHILIHRGIKPFSCDVCNKSYSTKGSLVEHRRTHSGDRPFDCDYCSMNFISKRRLIDHRRTHTGEKPHKCHKCNQAFIQRGSLTRHMKIHEKLKNAPATICEMI